MCNATQVPCAVCTILGSENYMTSEKDCSMTGRCCFITEAAGLTVVVVVVGGVGEVYGCFKANGTHVEI